MNRQEIPDVYLRQKYAWEGILNKRPSRRTFLRLGATPGVILLAGVLDSAAQKFKVKPQDTMPMQTPILLAREVKRELGKLVERVS